MRNFKEYVKGPVCKDLWTKLSRRKTVGTDFFDTEMKRCLGFWDIVFLGTGHMIGSGIYVLTGVVAKETTGPSVIVSYIISGFAAFLSSLCYAEFGGRVPKAGSAYSYGYVTIGEFWAFIIGWDMLLENMITAAALGDAWAGHLDGLIDDTIKNWTRTFGSMPETGGIMGHELNFVAAGIVLFVSVFMAVGVKLSTIFNSVFAVVNLLVITFTVIYGLTFARTEYLSDPSFCLKNMSCYTNATILHVGHNCSSTDAFMPNGVGGVVAGAARLFFAYIGFESIASAGEETINPRRTIPWGTLVAMIIVTVAYVMMSLTLTLMIPFCKINPDSAFATAFKDRGAYWAQYVVSIGALSGMTTVLFGALFATPRGVYAMATDGILCKCFGYIHPGTQTPIVGIIIFGVLSALIAMLFNLEILAEFISIGTLMAFSIVACSIIVLRYESNPVGYTNDNPKIESSERADKVGQLKDRFIFVKKWTKQVTPRQAIVLMICSMFCLSTVIHFGTWSPVQWWTVLLFIIILLVVLACLGFISLHEQDPADMGFKMPWVPLLPAGSLMINIILMLHLSGLTWLRFAIWLVIGVTIYFTYGMWHSVEGRRITRDQVQDTNNKQYMNMTKSKNHDS